ncbi:hypothetical protein J2X61_004714 [Bacillus sp. 3255]|nr:hypothetical protein [Bacillus sp. 3255]
MKFWLILDNHHKMKIMHGQSVRTDGMAPKVLFHYMQEFADWYGDLSYYTKCAEMKQSGVCQPRRRPAGSHQACRRNRLTDTAVLIHRIWAALPV